MHVQLLSCVQLSATPWTVACQAPPSTGFPGQEHWSGLPLLPPGGLSYPRTKSASPELASTFSIAEPPGKPHDQCTLNTAWEF